MSPAGMVLLGLEAAVFLLWAALLLRALLRLRARLEAREGRRFFNPLGLLREIGTWLAAPEDAAERRTLLVLTLGLMLIIAQSALMAR